MDAYAAAAVVFAYPAAHPGTVFINMLHKIEFLYRMHVSVFKVQ